MILCEERVAHSVSGRVYLANPGVSLEDHKVACKGAYGDLRGVRFLELPSGSELERAGIKGECWRLINKPQAV